MKKIFLAVILFLMLTFCNVVHANNGGLSFKVIQDNGTYTDTGLNISHVKQYKYSENNILELTFNKTGKELFAEITKNNIGKKVSIMYDNTVITEPIIQEPIKGGRVLIYAPYDEDETIKEAILNLTEALKNAGVPEQITPTKIILPVIAVITCILLLFGVFKLLSSTLFKNCIKNAVGFICKPAFITSLILIIALGGVGFGIYKWIEANSLPTCDSDYAIEKVKEYYSDAQIGLFYGTNVEVYSPVTTSYDKDIKKYECKARIKIDYHCDSLPCINGNPANSTYEGRIRYEIFKTRDGVTMYFGGPYNFQRTYRDWS